MEVGRLAGISHASVSQFEHAVHEPAAGTLGRLAKGLKVSTDYLLGLTDHPEPAATLASELAPGTGQGARARRRRGARHQRQPRVQARVAHPGDGNRGGRRSQRRRGARAGQPRLSRRLAATARPESEALPGDRSHWRFDGADAGTPRDDPRGLSAHRASAQQNLRGCAPTMGLSSSGSSTRMAKAGGWSATTPLTSRCRGRRTLWCAGR